MVLKPTYSSEKIIVLCWGHQWVWQFPQPLLKDPCDGVNRVILQFHRVWVWKEMFYLEQSLEAHDETT